MYQTLIIEYIDGSVEEHWIDKLVGVTVNDDLLKFIDIETGTYGVPLVNVKKYRIEG